MVFSHLAVELYSKKNKQKQFWYKKGSTGTHATIADRNFFHFKADWGIYAW